MTTPLLPNLASILNGKSKPDVPEKLSRSKREDAEWLEKVNKWFEHCRSARLPYEREWYTNLAFYFGKQWSQWVGTSDQEFARMIVPAAPPWRVRLVINKIKPIIRKELAKVNQERPRGYVVPASTDDHDLAASRAGEAVYEYVTEEEVHLRKVMRRATFWDLLCGTAFVKDWYEDDGINPEGGKGLIKAEPKSPFHILIPDVDEPELDKQKYVIHSEAFDVGWVEANFGIRVTPDSNMAKHGLLEGKFLNAVGAKTSQKDQVVVKEVWVRPNYEYPNGATIWWANDTILDIKLEQIFAHGEYPFTKIEHIPTGGFYGQSTIVDLIPIQKEYNRSRSQIIESKNRMSRPQLMGPKGSVDVKKLTTEPGLFIEYKPGMQPPTPLPLQNIPAYVLQDLDRTQRDMDDISSQHEVAQGRTPPGVEAATAIAYLQEQDDTPLGFTISSIEEAHQRMGKHFLSHAAQFWQAERTVRVVGQGQFLEAYIFNASDLRGGTDFRIMPGSATPMSRAAKQAFIMELVNSGMIPPDRGLQYLDMTATNRIFEEMQIDVRHAQLENLRMSNADPSVMVNEYDNHMVHIAEHEGYCKRQEFAQLDDSIKEMIITHIRTHKQVIAMEQGMPMMPDDPRLNALVKGGLPTGPPPVDNVAEPSAPEGEQGAIQSG